jgi:hypothetical protein
VLCDILPKKKFPREKMEDFAPRGNLGNVTSTGTPTDNISADEQLPGSFV